MHDAIFLNVAWQTDGGVHGAFFRPVVLLCRHSHLGISTSHSVFSLENWMSKNSKHSHLKTNTHWNRNSFIVLLCLPAAFHATHLEGTVHHPNDVVKLLVVHDDAVLLDVETQLLSETLPSRLTLQCTQCGRQRLWRRINTSLMDWNTCSSSGICGRSKIGLPLVLKQVRNFSFSRRFLLMEVNNLQARLNVPGWYYIISISSQGDK